MEEPSRTAQMRAALEAQGAAAVPSGVEEEQLKLVIFALGGGFYAFAGSEVTEILPLLEIAPVPGAPAFLPGVVNNRGDIDSVIDLHGLLGLPDERRSAAGRIVMATKDGVRSGVLVEEVRDVVDVPKGSIQPPLATLAESVKELVAGEVTYRGASVVLLNVGPVFARVRSHAG